MHAFHVLSIRGKLALLTFVGSVAPLLLVGVALIASGHDVSTRDTYIGITGALVMGTAAFVTASVLQRDILTAMAELSTMAARALAEPEAGVPTVSHIDRDLADVVDGIEALRRQILKREAELRIAHVALEQRSEERLRELAREKARFQCVFDAAPIGLSWMLRDQPESRIVNSAHARITGVPAEECRQLGRYREASHPDDRETQDTLHARLLAGQIDHYDLDKRYVHPDGTVRWVTLSVRFQPDPATGEIQEVNTVVDITDRRQAERAFAQASGLLDTLMENTPELIYFKDRESRFVHFSKAFLARFNLGDAKALIGKSDFDLFTTEHAQPAFDDEQEIIRTGVAIVGKVEKETYPDGTVTWAISTKMPWRDPEGRIIGTFGLSKDVTELKHAEAAAAYERDLLQILMDTIPDAIYFKDRDSRLVRVSRSKVERSRDFLRARHEAEHGGTERPTHLTSTTAFAAWLIGKTDADVYGPDRAAALLHEEGEIIRAGEAIVQRVEHTKFPDGRITWQVVSKMPWRDKDGLVIGTFGTSHDITPIKEAEAKLAATHKQLLELSRQAGMAEVATGVLHNVGNVLNSINVSATLVIEHIQHSKALNIQKVAELVADHQSDLGEFIARDSRGKVLPQYLQSLATAIATEHEQVCNELEDLRRNIDHIKDIVAMQQAYARTAGMIEPIPVRELVEDTLRINAGSLARHNVDTVRDYQAEDVIMTDRHKVIQILINLVRNAKYACDEAGRTDKEITIRTTSDERSVKIAVIDNGIGIPSENLTRIFSHGFTTRAAGHGFGLHSGANAAKELGGSLSVQSGGPGKGATFILELPRSVANPDQKERNSSA